MEQTSPPCRAIGIDLGTANTCVAVYRNGGTEIISDSGFPTMPSVVAFTATTRLIGAAAKNQAHANPSNTIFNALLFLGKDFTNPKIQSYMKRCPFAVVESDGLLQFKVEYKGSIIYVTPGEIISMILTRVRENAEAYLGYPVENAVLTIPCLFTMRERQMIRDIGLIAGLNVLSLLEGSVATAIHYCQQLENTDERNFLFYDLGAGSLDVALITFNGCCEVKAVHGDRFLGGSQIDIRLLEYCWEAHMQGYESADEILNNPRCLSRLGAACERAKRELTSQDYTLLEIDSFRDGIDFRATLNRFRLEEVCVHLFRSTLEPVERVLRDAKMNKHSVHDVVMTGSSSRIPKLQQYLSWFFDGKEVSKALNFDEAAACGASIHAAIYSNYKEVPYRLNNMPLLDCTAFSLGVESLGGVMTDIIKRNTTKPTKNTKIVEVEFLEGTDVQICLFEGERARTKHNTYISCVVLPLSRRPFGTRKWRCEVEVTFDLDLHGTLEVSMVERETNSRASASLENVGRFSTEEIKRMQRSAGQFKADEDAEIRRISERETLESFALKIKDGFASSKGMDQAADRLLTLIDATIEWLDDNPSAKTAEYRLKHNDLQRQLSLAETATKEPDTKRPIVSTIQRGRGKVQQPISFNTTEIRNSYTRSSSDGVRASQRQLFVPKHSENSAHRLDSSQGSPCRETIAERDACTPDGSCYATRNDSAPFDAGSFNKRPADLTAPYETSLGPREFRLLHRLGKEPLAFNLRTHKIEYPPQYRALSYAWAAQEKDKTVLCYSRDRNVQSIVQITGTIEDALTELTHENMPIWVDAVCIDQANHLEKSQQVKLMHRIYRRAHDVAIWLGKHQDDSALALDVLKWIAAPPALGSEDMSLPLFPALHYHLYHTRTSLDLDQVQNLATVVHKAKVVPTNKLDFRRLGLPDFDDDIWAAIGSILSPRWFHRLWTLQELLLARKPFVAFGSTHIPWRTYFDVGMQFSLCNLLGHCLLRLPYSFEYDMRAPTTFLRLVPFLNTDNSVVPFWQYLEEARHRDATEAVDRIYGMLSLANESLRSRINIDYSAAAKAKFWLVYMDAAKALMATSQLQNVLTSVNSVSKSSELPSWCPDFAQPCETRTFAANARAGRRHAKSFVPHYDDKIICIGGSRICNVSHIASSSWSWPQDANRVYGPQGIAAENLQWLDWCWSITQATYQHDEISAQRAFILTILGETPPSELPEGGSTDLAWFNDKENELTNLRHWLENLQVCNGPQDVEESPEVWHQYETMSRRLNDIWQNRRLCTTNNGRIGIGSHRVRPGDHVAVFFGESHVYFLRAKPAGVYEFISDGYVEGYMTGDFDDSALDNTAFKLI